MIPDHSRFQIFVVVVVQWLNHVYKYRNIYTLPITHASSVHSLPIVVWLCLTLCNPMDCSMPGFPVLHHLLDFAQLMSIESVIPSNHLILCHPFSSCLQSFPASRSFPMNQLFTSRGQSIGALASASVLPMTIQG